LTLQYDEAFDTVTLRFTRQTLDNLLYMWNRSHVRTHDGRAFITLSVDDTRPDSHELVATMHSTETRE
jgi:hypothetical protein